MHARLLIGVVATGSMCCGCQESTHRASVEPAAEVVMASEPAPVEVSAQVEPPPPPPPRPL